MGKRRLPSWETFRKFKEVVELSKTILDIVTDPSVRELFRSHPAPPQQPPQPRITDDDARRTAAEVDRFLRFGDWNGWD